MKSVRYSGAEAVGGYEPHNIGDVTEIRLLEE